MSETSKNAVISVYDKTDLIPFLRGLAEGDWQLFATEGTRNLYAESATGEIGSLEELVAKDGLKSGDDREITAQLVSGMMIGRKAVQLACINLRPPRLEDEDQRISLDEGGMSMISAASNSGAIVITQPESYEQVLTQINDPSGVDPLFRQRLQFDADTHIMDHLAAAHNLTL